MLVDSPVLSWAAATFRREAVCPCYCFCHILHDISHLLVDLVSRRLSHAQDRWTGRLLSMPSIEPISLKGCRDPKREAGDRDTPSAQPWATFFLGPSSNSLRGHRAHPPATDEGPKAQGG